ncbi:YitT family protein [Brevibacillus halotolerans]|uniref:YitT family protein n=1 Tax=Brevibacillus TaxID=55080 RepID=UPI00215CC9C2|nr:MULTISPECIES: YitT family protein [Brevibacillus]MCR8965415.1 YitT family protein [Brevibacillus laterosporus]MCZ0837570.1 YitT family protein [Brevibacillus halotolerans]
MRTKPYQQTFMILLGTFLLAFSYYHINFQNNLSEGGFVGLSLLGKYAFDWSPSITMLALDIPVILVAMMIKGRKFLINTIVAATSFSFFYELCERFSPLVFDFSNAMLLAVLLSGISTGFGLGLVLRFGGATGGDDILSLFISKLTGMSVGTVLLIFDVLVLLLSLFFLPIPQVLYTLLAVSIAGKVVTWTYEYGTKEKQTKLAHSAA